MAAVHVVVRGGGRLLVMMGFDRTLGRGATRGGVRGPGGRGERCIEQDDREQTEACGKGTSETVRRRVHVLLRPIADAGYYIVTRHSLQAGRDSLRVRDSSLYADSGICCITAEEFAGGHGERLRRRQS